MYVTDRPSTELNERIPKWRMTLHNLFLWPRSTAIQYPFLAAPTLSKRCSVCVLLAWFTIFVELVLAFTLHHQSIVEILSSVPVRLWTSFRRVRAEWMPYIWIFTTRSLFTIFRRFRSQQAYRGRQRTARGLQDIVARRSDSLLPLESSRPAFHRTSLAMSRNGFGCLESIRKAPSQFRPLYRRVPSSWQVLEIRVSQ